MTWKRLTCTLAFWPKVNKTYIFGHVPLYHQRIGLGFCVSQECDTK